MKVRTATAVLLLGLLTPGCIAVAAAAGAVGYVQYDRNAASRSFDTDLDDAFEAARDVVVANGYLVKQVESSEPNHLRLEGDKIKVGLEEFEGGKVKITVRVGTFDTEEHRKAAGELLDEIAKAL
ncbi:MAG: DUF3568 family protein [bacterium]|nr:DUF3568 family protein [bacterium]